MQVDGEHHLALRAAKRSPQGARRQRLQATSGDPRRRTAAQGDGVRVLHPELDDRLALPSIAASAGAAVDHERLVHAPSRRALDHDRLECSPCLVASRRRAAAPFGPRATTGGCAMCPASAHAWENIIISTTTRRPALRSAMSPHSSPVRPPAGDKRSDGGMETWDGCEPAKLGNGPSRSPAMHCGRRAELDARRRPAA